ncbi:MAG TPA: ABC transporter permease [Bryobacteraceae bacterium]|jgi:putative ABC transport system permease protein
MGQFGRDVRYGVRVFRKSPGFTAVAVLTLAVGIGAATAIFSVTDALLLRPLPFLHPERLALVSTERRGEPVRIGALSLPRFRFLAEHNRSFDGLAAFCAETFNLTGRGDPEQVSAARVSHDFFDVLGVHPALGRSFRADEGREGGEPAAVLGYEFWNRRFNGAASAIGQRLTLDSRDYTIVGVLPDDFRFDYLGPRVEVWVPRMDELNLMTRAQLEGGVMYLLGVGRLRPEASIRRAQAEMETLAAQYRAQNPKMPDAAAGQVVSVGDLRERLVANARTVVLILFGAVGLVLLIACANVASLLLSRALGRRREIAVRTAIGATRGELMRQLLTESVLLSVIGGAAGAALSSWGARALASLAADQLPRSGEVHTDLGVLGFALAVSTLAGVLFGIVPAMQVSRTDINTALRSEGRSATAGRRRNYLRSALVISQVALSMGLLVGAGLLVRNFVQIRSASPGFDAGHLLTMSVSLPPARYQGAAKMAEFFDELTRQVRAIPGVRSAAVASALPVNPKRLSPALLDGQPPVPIIERPLFNIQMVGPGYVATMRIPLMSGREFTERDDARAPKVAFVNETLVRRFWPRDNPLGKHILLGRQTQPTEVVGVVGDVRNQSVSQDTQPEIYVPFAQLSWPGMNLIVRTTGDPHGMAGAVRARVLALDRDQPVTNVQTMDEVLESAAAQPRFTTWLLGALAGTALALALVGIYGAIAYSVAERQHEMGIRMALGAARGDILRMVLRQGLTLASCGIAIGLAASLALTRLMASLLYHVSVTDPTTLAACALLFTLVALAASYMPARRATRVNPVNTL